MKNTRELIVERALELFNDKGLEYGGMRELAKLLDMRVSNITYYFPTKDDLIQELVGRLRELNAKALNEGKTVSLKGFMESYRQQFYNQYAYRCLFISFVHLFTHHAEMAEGYKRTYKKRKKELLDLLTEMVSSGYLKENTDVASREKILGHISLIGRFWISESIVTVHDRSLDETIAYYLGLVCNIFEPHTTAKGKRDINDFLSGLGE